MTLARFLPCLLACTTSWFEQGARCDLGHVDRRSKFSILYLPDPMAGLYPLSSGVKL